MLPKLFARSISPVLELLVFFERKLLPRARFSSRSKSPVAIPLPIWFPVSPTESILSLSLFLSFFSRSPSPLWPFLRSCSLPACDFSRAASLLGLVRSRVLLFVEADVEEEEEKEEENEEEEEDDDDEFAGGDGGGDGDGGDVECGGENEDSGGDAGSDSDGGSFREPEEDEDEEDDPEEDN